MNKETVISIVKAIGSAEIQQALEVTSHSVRHARCVGRFPASWFPVIRTLCAGRGIDCPEGVFNWRNPNGAAQ